MIFFNVFFGGVWIIDILEEAFGSGSEIAIGVANEKYDYKTYKMGIGADPNGYSWYVTKTTRSSIYYVRRLQKLDYGFDFKPGGNKCKFVITMYDNGTKFYTDIYFRDKKMHIDFIPELPPPIRFGVSTVSTRGEMSLKIVSQSRPLNS